MPGCPPHREVFGCDVVVVWVTIILVLDTPFRGVGVSLTTPWLSRMISSPGCAKWEATAQAMVLALYTCCGPCTRKAAREFPLPMPPPALPWHFEPSVYQRVVVGCLVWCLVLVLSLKATQWLTSTKQTGFGAFGASPPPLGIGTLRDSDSACTGVPKTAMMAQT